MTVQSVLLALLVYLLFSAPWCPVFAKAGKRWWVALLPVINLLVIMRIAGAADRGGCCCCWSRWSGIAVWTVVCLDVAERFGHGVPYTIGLVFLPFFFALWLGLGPDAVRAHARVCRAPSDRAGRDRARGSAVADLPPSRQSDRAAARAGAAERAGRSRSEDRRRRVGRGSWVLGRDRRHPRDNGRPPARTPPR